MWSQKYTIFSILTKVKGGFITKQVFNQKYGRYNPPLAYYTSVTPSLTKGSVFAASSASIQLKKNVNIQKVKGTRPARDSDFDIFLFKQLPQRYDTYIS